MNFLNSIVFDLFIQPVMALVNALILLSLLLWVSGNNADEQQCVFRILTSPDGVPMLTALPGSKVYYKWSCCGEELGIWCMTIYDCYTLADGKRKVKLLDENGCAVNNTLLDNLEYTSDLTAGQWSTVFAEGQESQLFFSCQIRYEMKENGVCKRTSDDCTTKTRMKRTSRLKRFSKNLSIASTSIKLV